MPIDFIKKRIVDPGVQLFRERVYDPLRDRRLVSPIIKRVSPVVENIVKKGTDIVESLRKGDEPDDKKIREVFEPPQIQQIQVERDKAKDFSQQLDKGTAITFTPALDLLLNKANIKHETDRESMEIIITETPDAKSRKKLVDEVGAEKAKNILADETEARLKDIGKIDPDMALPERTEEEKVADKKMDEKIQRWTFLKNNPGLQYGLVHYVGTVRTDVPIEQQGKLIEQITQVVGDRNIEQRFKLETEILEGFGHLKGTSRMLTTIFRPFDYYFTEAPAYMADEDAKIQADLQNISKNSEEFEKLREDIFKEKFWNLPMSWAFGSLFREKGALLIDQAKRHSKAWDLNKQHIRKGNKNAEAQIKVLLQGRDMGNVQESYSRINYVLEKRNTTENLDKTKAEIEKKNNQAEKFLDEDGNIKEGKEEEFNRLAREQRPLVEKYNNLIAEYNYLTRNIDSLSERYVTALQKAGIKYEVDESGVVEITDKEFLDAIEPYVPYFKRLENAGGDSGTINLARKVGRISRGAAELAAFIAIISLTKGTGKAALGAKYSGALKLAGGATVKAANKKGWSRILQVLGVGTTKLAKKAILPGLAGWRGYNEAMVEYAKTGDTRAAIGMGIAGAATTIAVIKAFNIPTKAIKTRMEGARWKQAAVKASKASDNAWKKTIADYQRRDVPLWQWGKATKHFEIKDVAGIGKTKDMFLQTKNIPAKQISRISVSTSATKPVKVPIWKVGVFENKITGKRFFRPIPSSKTIHANDITFTFKMKDGRIFANSVKGLSEKPLKTYGTLEEFMKATKGKKFYFLEYNPDLNRNIYMSTEMKNVKMVDGKMKLVPFKTKDITYMMKQYGFNPKTNSFKVETRLPEKKWRRMYPDIERIYKRASPVGKAEVKKVYSKGDNIPREFFKVRDFSFTIDKKGTTYLIRPDRIVVDRMTGLIKHDAGIALSKKESVVTNLNRIKDLLERQFQSFGLIPDKVLLKISNKHTMNTLKKFYQSMKSGRYTIELNIGEIDKLDPVLRKAVLKNSELKNIPSADVLKTGKEVKYTEIKQMISPDVKMEPYFRGTPYTPTVTPEPFAEYTPIFAANENILGTVSEGLKDVSSAFKLKEFTPIQQRDVRMKLKGIEGGLRDINITQVTQDINSRLDGLESGIEQMKNRLKELQKTFQEYKSRNIQLQINDVESRIKQAQKQQQQLKNKQKAAQKLQQMFKTDMELFKDLVGKFKKKPVKDLPIIDVPDLPRLPRRVKKIVEGQGYIALVKRRDRKWVGVSPSMNRNGAVYHGFQATLRDPQSKRFRVRRIGYKKQTRMPGVSEPPKHLFRRVKFDKIGKVPVEEEWIQKGRS